MQLRSLGLGLIALAAAGIALPNAATADPVDPPFSVDPSVMDAAVDCVTPADVRSDVEPVVLVHGTFTKGHEQYAWNYELRLADEGIPYCVVTYPDRGFGDQQVSAEYVAYAVQKAAAVFDADAIDLMGHSQGASMPRWAIKYWPSVQGLLDDVVLHAGPFHGTDVAAGFDGPTAGAGGANASSWQFDPDSDFNWYVNQGDETPGDIDYTSIYAQTDELVQPSIGPDATAILDGAVNIDVQAVCPGRVVDHLSIGTTDAFVMELTIDAFLQPGPARVGEFAWLSNLCTLPNQYVTPAQFAGFQGACCGPTAEDFEAFRSVDSEPEPKGYAVERDGERPATD